jgi:hypothetical protein
MAVPTPPTALAALARRIRRRLADVQDTFGPLRTRQRWSLSDLRKSPETVHAAARQVATVIVAAAAPYASNSYARTRLIRQMHAAGLLTLTEAEQAEHVLGVAE